MNRNRLFNTQNSYQNFNKYKRVLCVCSAGLLRSPTMARVLQEEYGYNTRAAGVSTEYALIPVDEYLLEWADEVVCADPVHMHCIYNSFPKYKKEIICLDIPDNYGYMDEKLVEIIKQRYQEALQ